MSRVYDPSGLACDACLNRDECPRHFQMKRWPKWCFGGSSYWSRGKGLRFSFNEGEYPTVFARLGQGDYSGFYIALAPGLKLSSFWKPFPWRRLLAR